MEFALVGAPFLFMLIFCFEIAYDYFAQAALDFAVQTAVRSVQIGSAQTLTPTAQLSSAQQFQATYVCTALGSLLPCANVAVNVQPVTTDFAQANIAIPIDPKTGLVDTSAFGFCPGQPGQLMMVQAIYTGPSFVFGLIPALSPGSVGTNTHLTLSTAAFVNEPFAASNNTFAGCT